MPKSEASALNPGIFISIHLQFSKHSYQGRASLKPLVSSRLSSSARPFPISVAEAAITSVTDAETVKNSGLRNNDSLTVPKLAPVFRRIITIILLVERRFGSESREVHFLILLHIRLNGEVAIGRAELVSRVVPHPANMIQGS
jgi:hypothetical protein